MLEKLKSTLEGLNGKKSYLVAVAAVVYALTGLYLGYLDAKTAVEIVLGALGLGTLRHGMAKLEDRMKG